MSNNVFIIHQNKIWFLIIVFVVTGLFCYGYNLVKPVETSPEPPIKEPAPLNIPREYSPNDSLLDLKIERDRERSREIENIQELLDKIGLSDEVRKQAEEELWRLTQAAAKEHELENLLKAKGFTESLVTISQRLVSIVIAQKLQPAQVENIGELAAEVTAFNLEQIQIIER